jgi:hypothetical protein
MAWIVNKKYGVDRALENASEKQNGQILRGVIGPPLRFMYI